MCSTSHKRVVAVALALFTDSLLAMGSFLDRWDQRYEQYTNIGSSSQRCQICHVSPTGGSANGWNSYGWRVFELLESRKPFDQSDLDYAFDFAGLINSDADPSGAKNLTEIQTGFFPGWSLGAVNVHHFGSPSGAFSQTYNHPPPANIGVALLDPPAMINNPSAQVLSPNSAQVSVAQKLTHLNWPRRLVVEASQSTSLYIVELDGKVTHFDTVTNQSSLFVDIAAELSAALLVDVDYEREIQELGLLNLAFSPAYESNALFYTFHTEILSGQSIDFTTMPNGIDPHHLSVITEWQVVAKTGETATALNSRTLLRIAHPQAGNTGGGLQFDSSGALLIGLGDGGASGDQDQTVEFNGSVIPSVRGHGTGNAKDLTNPLGAVLRILPSAVGSDNGQYGVPLDNPFVGVLGQVGEIFAYGFKNPNQIVVDPMATFVSDPGEVAIDELNGITSGLFYGWGQYEGEYKYNLNGFDDSYLSVKSAIGGNEQAPALSLDRTLGQGFVFDVMKNGNASPIVELDFEWLVAVRDNKETTHNVKLFGLNFGVEPHQPTLSPVRISSSVEPLELIHAVKILPDGRVFIAANTNRDIESGSGVVLEVIANDESTCFPVRLASSGRFSVVCL